MASAIQKTFKCIEALSRSPAGLTVSEVASIAGFSRPAATRLLEGLTADSIIIRDARSKRYRLGLRLYEWSTAAVQGSLPINVARREFIKLSMDLGRECNFIVLEDTDAVLLERSEDVDGVPLNRPIPGRRVWCQTATGKAIVAFSEPAIANSIVERTTKRKDAPPLDREALAAELEEIRQRGYAVTVGIRPEGFMSLGVPILGHSGYAVAAIGTFITTSDMETEAGNAAVAQMKAATSRVSHYLGYETETAALVS
ncbi:MAG TPA: IclR family transcriptional regulator [Dehalococcoidia bacterium]|nr:IclR family transcriptional regulator [Dehalococcoidia bacterium]